MSRHELAPSSDAIARDGTLSVAIGWDPPLATYFAIVRREDEDVDDEAAILLWIGTGYEEIREPEPALEAIRPFASFDDDFARALRADRLREGSRPRAPWVR
ncbi:hypothetical protein PX554_20065 [Sphingomonas sp. H39-1-10]|uniref:hypothetical protein n=1 Tax=Sphingomonas pollutisoli TaxID=3030829 RepID=UPI0023B8FBB2|nr:hypothetical protein [Sphingomonas pollutisoli]MDF0490429.1 hypothetical protein [Sphingomonas pollutisoli]